MGFTEETATGAVVASFQGAPDPRLREVEPTFGEWQRAIGFLTETGQLSDDTRQEFILLSDVLGVTMLVDATNHRVASAGTNSTVLGPFHMVASPRRELGRHHRPGRLVAADGHLPVTTHVSVAGSPYSDSDAVFAVKQSLVRDFARVDPAQAAAFGVPAPFRHATFDVVLQPAPDPEPG